MTDAISIAAEVLATLDDAPGAPLADTVSAPLADTVSAPLADTVSARLRIATNGDVTVTAPCIVTNYPDGRVTVKTYGTMRRALAAQIQATKPTGNLTTGAAVTVVSPSGELRTKWKRG